MEKFNLPELKNPINSNFKEESSKVEFKRLERVLRSFKKKHRKICLSLDTRKSDIMIKGLKFGVDLINDVSGFSYDKASSIILKLYSFESL